MNNNEKEFYLNLGILSTQFAIVEEYIRAILAMIMNRDNLFIGLYAIENNTLEINLQLFKKINQIVGYEKDELNRIIEKIHLIKKTRNSFIHGVWSKPEESGGEIQIYVSKSKIKFIEDEGDGSPAFYSSSQDVYTLTEIKENIKKLKDINNSLKPIHLNLLMLHTQTKKGD
jgi:hypothetical protein